MRRKIPNCHIIKTFHLLPWSLRNDYLNYRRSKKYSDLSRRWLRAFGSLFAWFFGRRSTHDLDAKEISRNYVVKVRYKNNNESFVVSEYQFPRSNILSQPLLYLYPKRNGISYVHVSMVHFFINYCRWVVQNFIFFLVWSLNFVFKRFNLFELKSNWFWIIMKGWNWKRRDWNKNRDKNKWCTISFAKNELWSLNSKNHVNFMISVPQCFSSLIFV